MPSKRCMDCGLVNPASAVRCDCGLDFVTGARGKPLDVRKPYAPDAPYGPADPPSVGGRMMIMLGRMVIAVIVVIITAILQAHFRR